jgi:hypothetical protein
MMSLWRYVACDLCIDKGSPRCDCQFNCYVIPRVGILGSEMYSGSYATLFMLAIGLPLLLVSQHSFL